MIETRQVTETRIWKLIVNPMRGNIEESQLVAWSEDKQKLIDWYNSLKVEPYTEEGSPSFACQGSSHKWRKVFQKGSWLEWYNPIYDFEGVNHFGQGIRDEWVPDEVLNSSKVTSMRIP